MARACSLKHVPPFAELYFDGRADDVMHRRCRPWQPARGTLRAQAPDRNPNWPTRRRAEQLRRNSTRQRQTTAHSQRAHTLGHRGHEPPLNAQPSRRGSERAGVMQTCHSRTALAARAPAHRPHQTRRPRNQSVQSSARRDIDLAVTVSRTCVRASAREAMASFR